MARRTEPEQAVSRFLEALERDRLQRRLMLLSMLVDGCETDEQRRLEDERFQVRTRLARYEGLGPIEEFEAAFVAHASAFARLHNICAATWRTVGVPEDVLKRARLHLDK